jgi:hypothetical protein
LIVRCWLDRLRLLDRFHLFVKLTFSNKLGHYLANLATMILINLLYRRFDNLLRTISEIVTCGIVLAIRERERQDKKSGVVSTEINNDKVAAKKIRRSSSWLGAIPSSRPR